MKNETNEVNFKIMTADFQILQAVSTWAKIEMHEGMALVPETNQSERRHIMTDNLQIKGVKKGDAVVVCNDVWTVNGQGTLVNIPFASEGEIGVVVGVRDFACRVKFCDGRRLDIDKAHLERVVNVNEPVLVRQEACYVEDPDKQIDGIRVGRIVEKAEMTTWGGAGRCDCCGEMMVLRDYLAGQRCQRCKDEICEGRRSVFAPFFKCERLHPGEPDPRD